MASLYQKDNGKWIAQVNGGGQRRAKSFDTKTEARRWARQQEAAVDAGKPVQSGHRFLDIMAAYVEAAGPMSRSKAGALVHINDLIGMRKLAALDVSAFRHFAQAREAEGAGPATIAQDLSYIGTVLRHGAPLLKTSALEPLDALATARTFLRIGGQISRPDERTRRPTDVDLIALRDFWAKRRRGIPMWALTQFAITTAMRLSEITSLRWDDLDRENRTILIRDRKHPRAKKGNHQRVPLLNGPTVISGMVVDPMALIAAQPVEDHEPRIFPYDASTISTMFSRAVSSCGIADLRFHDLRHDGVSRLFEAGYRIEEVSIVSGHRDWAMLRRYTNLKAESLHRAVLYEPIASDLEQESAE